jgi:hypothetical protein
MTSRWFFSKRCKEREERPKRHWNNGHTSWSGEVVQHPSPNFEVLKKLS